MKFIQNLWRSIASLFISFIGVFFLMFLICRISPQLFQNGIWAKIGVLAIGIELGALILYLGIMLITGAILIIAKKRKAPRFLACLPLVYAIVRYPYWLIAVCLEIPLSLGFLQWLIIIFWLGSWIILFGIAIVSLLSNE